jgi:WD40 repeat protein
VAAAGIDAVVGVWDFQTGTRLLQKPEPNSGIRCLALSPRGKLLACGMFDGTVCLRDLDGGPVKARLSVSRSRVNDVCFSGDGHLIAAVGTNSESADCMARVWTVDKAALLHQFSCGKGTGTAVAFSPDGRSFAAANRLDRRVRIWDLESSQLMYTLSPAYRLSDWPVNVFFSPDGKRIVVSSNKNCAHTWDIASGKQLAEGRRGGGSYATANSPDARWIVSSGYKSIVQIWDPAGRGVVLDLNSAPDVDSGACFGAAFSSDGRYVATSHDLEVSRITSRPPQPQRIRVWELASGSEVMRFQGHRGRVSGLVFSHDFRELVSGSRDTTVLVWPLDPYAAGSVLTVPPKKKKRWPGLPVGDPFAGSLPVETDNTRNDAAAPAVDPPGELDEEALSSLWKQLAGEAPRAYRAKWRLIRHPQQATRLFANHLKPMMFDPTEARQWAAQLDDDSFAVREAAFQRLAVIGELATGVLRETLEQGVSVEVKARINRLLAAHHPILIEDKETLRACRAIEVLERIGSPEARELIDRLATGAAEVAITRHAQGAQARLKLLSAAT